MPAGAYQAIHSGLHDDLQHALGHNAQEVVIASFGNQLGKGSTIVGHRDQTPRVQVKLRHFHLIR